MNVLASVMTPATAKTAHKPDSSSAEGSDTTDFAAMLEAVPTTGAGQKAMAAAKVRQGVKTATTPEVQEGSLPTETPVVDAQHSKSKAAKPDKTAKDEEGADTSEAKVQMPNESASVVALTVVPIATSHMEHVDGGQTKGRMISSIASGKGQAPVISTAEPTVEASSSDAPMAFTTEAGATEGEVIALVDATGASDTQTDSAIAAGQIKPGEATELLQQLSGTLEKKTSGKTQAESAPQNALSANETNGDGRETSRLEAGRVESPRSGTHGAEVTRTETGRVKVVQPDVAHTVATRTGSDRSDFAQAKSDVVAPLVRSAVGNSNSAKLADGTASGGAAAGNEIASVASAPTAQGKGDRSDQRDERGRDTRKVAPSTDMAASSAVVAASFGAPTVSGDAVVSQSTGAVSAALDQKVIDIGVSGQWLDSLSHEIATVAAANGQGSFNIAPENLGGIRVDITQGDAGTNIRMTVGNEAARFALQQDSDRLLKDAQLSSVRIADIQVDMVAPASGAQQSDMNQNGQGHQQNSQNASGWTSNANGNAAGQGQRNAQFTANGQSADSGSGGNQPKFGRNNDVSTEMKRADGGSARMTEMQRARYA